MKKMTNMKQLLLKALDEALEDDERLYDLAAPEDPMPWLAILKKVINHLPDKGVYTPRQLRALELMSVITEEWGEAVKEINNWIWKGAPLANANDELAQIKSPFAELEELIMDAHLEMIY
jgi:hypothetical protein